MDVLEMKDAETVARAVLSTRAQLLDAIERELAARGAGYADHALRLAEAYARVTGLSA